MSAGAEVVAEALQVAGGRAAPAVDRLVRVAHRGHRVAGAEQRAQQHELRVAGVLVLVEQHDAVLRPLPRAHVRHLARDPRGQRHLVAEVDRAQVALAPRVRRDDRHQLAPRRQPLQVLEDLRARLAGARLAEVLRPRRRRVHDPFQLGGDVVDVQQVLGALAGQVEDGGGHRPGPDLDVRELAVPAAHEVVGELPRGGLAEQPGVRLEPEPQAVVGEQRGGVGVVGRDLDRLRVGEHAPARQPAQPRPHPLAQLAGRLAGEREAEHLVRLDDAVRDEPDDARRHRLGLARAGARDDEQRCRRRLDDRGLLRRRLRTPEDVRDPRRREPDLERSLDRKPRPLAPTGRGGRAPQRVEVERELPVAGAAGCWRAHSPTCRPCGCSGQLRVTGHVRHISLAVAAKPSPAMPSADALDQPVRPPRVVRRGRAAAAAAGRGPSPCARAARASRRRCAARPAPGRGHRGRRRRTRPPPPRPGTRRAARARGGRRGAPASSRS